MRKLSTVQNAGFPNIFSFHIIHYTLFSSLKNICNKKDFHVAQQTCWWKRPFHVGCQDKSGPSKIHEVILVKPIVLLKFSLSSSRWIFVVITWTHMLDGKANGCSQWFLSHQSAPCGLEKPLLAGYPSSFCQFKLFLPSSLNNYSLVLFHVMQPQYTVCAWYHYKFTRVFFLSLQIN